MEVPATLQMPLASKSGKQCESNNEFEGNKQTHLIFESLCCRNEKDAMLQ